MQCVVEVIARTQWSAHTKSLDANDKLIQARSHVRDTIASRKRQLIMRKGKSTVERYDIIAKMFLGEVYYCNHFHRVQMSIIFL